MTSCPNCGMDATGGVAQCTACSECDVATAEVLSCWVAWERAMDRRRKAFEARLKAIAALEAS